MNAAQLSYVDFNEYISGIPAEERARLAGKSVLFVYPVIDANEFELVEQPVAQRILMSVCRSVGCRVMAEVASVNDVGVTFTPRTFEVPDTIVVHPMMNILPRLAEVLGAYKERFPGATVVLQTSDQHQHEKVIGGPRAAEIANHLLMTYLDVDFVLIGFAEHALVSLLAGGPSEAVIDRQGVGSSPLRVFNFASLPEPEPVERLARDRTARIQRSRGCLAPCTFCIEGQSNRTLRGERAWDGLNMDTFVGRIENVAKSGSFFVTITDSSFEDPGRRGLAELLRFADLIVERGIRLSFKIHMRSENMLRLSFDDLDRMKRAGIDVIGCGIESGIQEELDFIRKIASKEVSRDAYIHVESYGKMCIILGYIMLSPISTAAAIQEKTEFLRKINRGWDFLILTNRLLTFWGTQMHRDLVREGLADDGPAEAGYVPYCFKDPAVGRLDRAITDVKRTRPGFMRMNNLMFDAINLESRMFNPVNAEYRSIVGARFDSFRERLANWRCSLTDSYCDGLAALADDPTRPFLPDFREDEACDRLKADIADCLAPLSKLPAPPTTLYLNTWMSVVNKFSVAG